MSVEGCKTRKDSTGTSTAKGRARENVGLLLNGGNREKLKYSAPSLPQYLVRLPSVIPGPWDPWKVQSKEYFI